MTLIEKLLYEPTKLKFGTSGLRALVTEMTDLECYINTLGFIRFCKSKDEPLEKLYVAGDLRNSTPRIAKSVVQAGIDSGLNVTFLGLIPTPFLALKAFTDGAASVMVTGSHIPSDRNGIKYYKPTQELMKVDESSLLEFVEAARDECYEEFAEVFNEDGMLVSPPELIPNDLGAKELFFERLIPVYSQKPLEGMTVGVFEHSAVGREYLKELLESAGAQVIGFDRSDHFVPVDTENVTKDDVTRLKSFAAQNKVDAIVSTDGDSDRPMLADSKGHVWNGDVMGLVVAKQLEASACAYPVSANDLLDANLAASDVKVKKTKIGSPYVISAMDEFNVDESVVGWEVNGGFLVGKDVTYNNHVITPLETRDAFLPLLLVLATANISKQPVQSIFENLQPRRFGDAGLVDIDDFETMKSTLDELSKNKESIPNHFTAERGYGVVQSIDETDGIRIAFSNNDVAHIRGSGNAPQLRVYATADTQARAAEIVQSCIGEKGIFKELMNGKDRSS